MRDLRRHIKRFATLDCAMIIYGETGVGKELAARSIHALSARRTQRFMAINCGSFSNDLFIEELMGFGANTLSGDGRDADRTPGGTILLDQIEDLSPRMQVAMLKVLDRKKESAAQSGDGAFDMRILAASSHDLEERVHAGHFREELFYRLNVVELTIPPLRERRDDIAPLSRFFLNRFNREFGKSVDRIADEVAALLQAYDFPGNVRELEHIIERAVILTEDSTLEARHLPERFRQVESQTAAPAPREYGSLADVEKKYILEVLAAFGGNKSKTAETLGISRAALWRKLKQYDHQ
jgi:two-component system response regulator AtoC